MKLEYSNISHDGGRYNSERITAHIITEKIASISILIQRHDHERVAVKCIRIKGFYMKPQFQLRNVCVDVKNSRMMCGCRSSDHI